MNNKKIAKKPKKVNNKPKSKKGRKGTNIPVVDYEDKMGKLQNPGLFSIMEDMKMKETAILKPKDRQLLHLEDDQDLLYPVNIPRIIGASNNAELIIATNGKRKRKRQIVNEWDLEFPSITNEIPSDSGLSDKELISIGLNNQTTKLRWLKVPYIQSKKGIVYETYNYLFLLKDDNGLYLQLENV